MNKEHIFYADYLSSLVITNYVSSYILYVVSVIYLLLDLFKCRLHYIYVIIFHTDCEYVSPLTQ